MWSWVKDVVGDKVFIFMAGFGCVFFHSELNYSSGHCFEFVSCCWRQARHMLGHPCAMGSLGSAPSPSAGLFPCCLENQGKATAWWLSKDQGLEPHTFHPGSPSRHIHTEEAVVAALLSFAQL